MDKREQLVKQGLKILYKNGKLGKALVNPFLDTIGVKGDLFIPPEIPIRGKRKLMAIADELARGN